MNKRFSPSIIHLRKVQVLTAPLVAAGLAGNDHCYIRTLDGVLLKPHNKTSLTSFCDVFCAVFPSAHRDGLFFELENGKPKVILLNPGESN